MRYYRGMNHFKSVLGQTVGRSPCFQNDCSVQLMIYTRRHNVSCSETFNTVYPFYWDMMYINYYSHLLQFMYFLYSKLPIFFPIFDFKPLPKSSRAFSYIEYISYPNTFANASIIIKTLATDLLFAIFPPQ